MPLEASRTNNRTKRALWEYDNLIQSLYLLNYIDSASLRQNVQRAVNRGESYHQLRRTIVGDARVERSNLTKK
jgi:TnpA family transposase